MKYLKLFEGLRDILFYRNKVDELKMCFEELIENGFELKVETREDSEMRGVYDELNYGRFFVIVYKPSPEYRNKDIKYIRGSYIDKIKIDDNLVDDISSSIGKAEEVEFKKTKIMLNNRDFLGSELTVKNSNIENANGLEVDSIIIFFDLDNYWMRR